MDEFDIQDQEYFYELILFLSVAVLLILFKIFACCQSLGLSQRHKQISQRTDPISRAEFYNLRTTALTQEDFREDTPLEVSGSAHRNLEVSGRTQQSERSVQRSLRNSFTQTEQSELKPILFSDLPQPKSCSPNLPVEKYQGSDTGLLTQIVQVHYSSANQAE